MTEAERLFGEHYPLVSRYVDILSSTGVAWGLIGPREVDRLWDRHILNSVAAVGLIPQGCRVVDVGSGAGLPGLPIALLRSDLRVTLLEPLLRRSTFLTQTVDELGMSSTVRVVRERAEDHAETYDVVLARALAPLGRLVGWCDRLRTSTGIILALKGQSVAAEVADARAELAAAHLQAEVVTVRATSASEPTNVVRMAARGNRR